MRARWIALPGLILVAGSVVVLLLLREGRPSASSSDETGRAATLRLDGRERRLCILVADTPAERERGLGHRDRMDPFDGMLFVFEAPLRPGFWMKDTRFPLDLGFVDESGRIAESVTMPTCPDDRCPTFQPVGTYQRAVELPAGTLASGERAEIQVSGRACQG